MSSGRADSILTFCCRPDNDLYRAVSRTRREPRFDEPGPAIQAARPGTGILFLDGSQLPADLASEARAKHLRTYVEDAPRPGDPPDTVKNIEWERVIVTTGLFGKDLAQDRILSIGRIPIRSAAPASDVLLAVGRVAGFDRLAFGLPKQTTPLLWQPEDERLVAGAALSYFARARFAPGKAWKPVWQYILTWLGAPDLASRLAWEPSVTPTYSESARLPKDAAETAIRRAGRWFLQSHLLLSEADLDAYAKADRWPDRVGPIPHGGGDGHFGIAEGYSSAIDSQGTQPVRWYRRADCNAESAMALALAGQRSVAENIADFIAFRSDASQGDRNDPSKQCYGLVGWNDLPANRGTFFGDDNARYILGLIGTAGALKESRWDDAILRCILANFRTSGTNGFRGDVLGEGDIERLGWRHYFDAPTVNMAPHFEAYLWACYLWAYARTGYKPLLERTEKAIETTLNAGENAWTWTNGSQQERARMLLPLSWLVRVDDSPKHRAWLDDMVRKVIGYQAQCGAIREEFGDLSHGIAGPPRTNEAYGTTETPLIQENGDPLADMLYTSNFAFLGIHEAAAATHDPVYERAESKLADFFCRIQIRSESHPELDGAWFRAFDYGDWDYWASNADLGWGAWSIETGWSVSWITSILALRQRHESFWDIDPGFKADQKLISQMLPERG